MSKFMNEYQDSKNNQKCYECCQHVELNVLNKLIRIYNQPSEFALAEDKSCDLTKI